MAFDSYAGVTEIPIVEDFRGFRFDETPVKLHDVADLIGLPVAAFSDLSAFVS